ncbi:BnaCnng05420D [Brassica napus]|uniref:BnaCnng05420D protein n=1 Tax=Brassica napus TaxID=3708 RepID=A0A078GS35_BRANA|nr:BnaCnng05420D [Brassica napus]
MRKEILPPVTTTTVKFLEKKPTSPPLSPPRR